MPSSFPPSPNETARRRIVGTREQDEPVHRDSNVLVVPWKKTPSKRPREIILPGGTSSHPDPRPIRAETRAKLVTAIAKGRHWLDELIAGTVTNVEQIAARENCSSTGQPNDILAFIAPTLVQAAVDGRLPRGIGIANRARFPRRMDPCNTRDLAWPHKTFRFQGTRRRDQNFFGRRPSPNFGRSRLPETKYRKSCVEQAALTRAFLAKSL